MRPTIPVSEWNNTRHELAAPLYSDIHIAILRAYPNGVAAPIDRPQSEPLCRAGSDTQRERNDV